jgi:chromosome segregation ATPase
MAEVGLTEASRLTGKDPSTIARRSNHKDISKRLSFRTNDLGERLYDVAELERVFGKLGNPNVQHGSNSAKLSQGNSLQDALQVSHERETALLRDQVNLLRVQLESTNEDRNHWRKQATYLLEDKNKKEEALDERVKAEQELKEKLAQEKAEQEQIVQRLTETQASLEKVRSSWLGRLLFKV